MRWYFVIPILALVLGCGTSGTIEPEEIAVGADAMTAVVFYGVVTDAVTGKVIPGANVEVDCETCGWHQITVADEYGVYAFEGEAHIGHSGTIMAGANSPGHQSVIKAFKNLPSYSNRINFALPLL